MNPYPVHRREPVIEYFEDGKKITVPIVYENINDESFITLKDIVYQKIK